jgi:hypothetical protein
MNKYPFNKERAIKGEPVVTRDGRKAKFVEVGKKHLCFNIEDDGNWWFEHNGKFEGISKDYFRDLFMLTPDPAPSAPIPFDWDKYNSGEWDVVYRDGNKPKGVYHISVLEVQQILTISNEGQTLWHYLTGEYLRSKTQHGYDLLLTPKQVTRWFNAYKDKYNNVGAGCTHDSEQDALANLANIDSERVHIGTYSFTTNEKP